MQSTQPDISPKDRSTALLLFGFLLACYMFTFTGLIDSSDGLSTFATTDSLVRRGALDSNQVLWMGNQQGNIGPDGNLYTRKGLGMVLLAWPLVWAAKVWPFVGLAHAAMLLNPLLTAWTGALLFRAGRRLGWSRPLAISAALIFGLLTMAWPYTQSFFSDPVAGWGLFAAAYGLLAYAQSERKLYLFGSGLAWGIAYLTRTINIMTLPIYAVALLLVLTPSFAQSGATFKARLRHAFWAHWRPVVAFTIPIVAMGLLSLWWNWVRFGNIWDTGYVETETFSANWFFGLFGLTVGPARGVLWYNPILVLAIPGALWFWRRQRRIFFLALALIVVFFAVYAKWYMWHGGYSWGARFIVPTLPFLTLLAAPAWNALMGERRLGWLGIVIGVGLALASLAVQVLGLLVPYHLVQDRLAELVSPLFADVTFTQLQYSPLVMQWQMVQPATIHLAWWRGAAGVDWLPLAVAVAGVSVGLFFLTQELRNTARRNGDERLRNWLYTTALLLLTTGLLTYYDTTRTDPELRLVARRLQQEAQAHDGVLLLRPEMTQHFANVYRGALPVFGLFQRNDLRREDTPVLAHMRAQLARLWVVPNYLPPDQSGWERALRSEDFLLSDDRVTGPSQQRLALYALAPAAELVESGVGTVFGDPTASSVSEANGWIRLNGYGLTPTATPGGQLLLTLLWESLQPVTTDYQVFVHLLDAQGNKLLQRDGQPVVWLRPTSTWQPGDVIVDRYGLLLPSTLPAGRYTLAVGLYDQVTGQRLAVSAGPASYAIELGPVQVE
ncbi:MAG TPA: hypothetical protein DCL15_00320 [Chloroflexi bacterium]|nr:hypothetical protein [Chloroflexota bacterium]HHW85987.1 hypothetical protein [Chloroflexota bacterium]